MKNTTLYIDGTEAKHEGNSEDVHCILVSSPRPIPRTHRKLDRKGMGLGDETNCIHSIGSVTNSGREEKHAPLSIERCMVPADPEG